MNSQTLVALGSNQNWGSDPPELTVLAAIGAIGSESVGLLATSRLFRSPAFPAGSGPDYVNAVVGVRTNLSPAELLAHLHSVEAHFGRVRAARWGSRTLDLDLIAVGDLVLPDAGLLRRWIELPASQQRTDAPNQLILPHPRLQDRAFVLLPMADIAPAWRHPLTGRSVTEMLAALPEKTKAEVHPL